MLPCQPRHICMDLQRMQLHVMQRMVDLYCTVGIQSPCALLFCQVVIKLACPMSPISLFLTLSCLPVCLLFYGAFRIAPAYPGFLHVTWQKLQFLNLFKHYIFSGLVCNRCTIYVYINTTLAGKSITKLVTKCKLIT